jgi:hypothetical protein
MIHEYALEPELVATLSNRNDFRYFIEKFGLGQPRIVSRYPKTWKRLVWEAFQSDDDMEKLRMTELLTRFSERMVHRRNCVWEPDRPWLQNAHQEHTRVPFHAILARANAGAHPSTLTAGGLDDATALWAVPRGVTIARSAVEMASAAVDMLRIADAIIFVDPYFRPGRIENRRPLEAFLRAVVTARPLLMPTRIEVHTSLDEGRSGTREFFEEQCARRLPQCVPGGVRLVILRLRERPGGERLHNRYILTDVGGLIFGVGLDDGAPGETDDVTVMDRAQYELRWSQHAAEPMGFDIPEPRVEIQSRR